MLFAPVERKDYSTITWSDVWSRAEPAGRIDDVFEGLKDGSLKAYVQPSGDPRFYRVPKEHWDLGIFELEGQPAPILICESDALVPRQFHDLPLLFFEDEVASWEKTLPAHEPIDETDWDYAVFDRYYSQAQKPRGGYWTAFATLSWIATRDERFVAAVQAFEEELDVNRGGVEAAAAWMTFGNKAGMQAGKTLTDAVAELREALESDHLKGGVAFHLRDAERQELPRYAWLQWSRIFDGNGLVLVPGYRDFRWPSEAVQAAFPFELRSPANEAVVEAVPQVQSTGAAIRECEAWLREQFALAETEDWTKPTFAAKALAKFAGRLSRRGFNTAWSNAAKGFPERAKAGAKKKSPRAN